MISIHYKVRHVIASLMFLFCSNYMTAQTDTRMQYFPATDNHYAGLNVYSTTTAEFNQFYVEDGKWVKNNFIPQPKFSISGGDYRIKYIPRTEKHYAGLFAYSRKSGEFEVFYLEGGEWKSNGLFPKSKISYGNKDVILDFIPATGGEVAYLTAYSADGERFGIYYVDGMKWVQSELYPK